MTPETLAQVMAATWPPARAWACGPFTLRDGAGGGKRASAASCDGPWSAADLDAALAQMADPVFMIRPGEAALDGALAVRGFRVVDLVVIYSSPVASVQGELPLLAAFPHWPPLEIARSIWHDGGVTADRVAVMDRVIGPKTALLTRLGDRSAGVAFVAMTGTEAMLHAVEVRLSQRRQGAGATLLRAAANWAAAAGATRLSLAVTAQNLAARALYTRAGMQAVGQYHYRMR